MAVKAVCKDKEGIQHLIIGLSRENLNTLVDGEVLTMPQGLAANITEASDIVLLFAETDAELKSRMSPLMRAVQ
jgi:hypothetical protein